MFGVKHDKPDWTLHQNRAFSVLPWHNTLWQTNLGACRTDTLVYLAELSA